MQLKFKMRSVIYFLSSVLSVTTNLVPVDVCHKNIQPCTCEGFMHFMFVTCENFDNINQVTSVLRLFHSPIPHLTITHNSTRLTNDVFHEVRINRLFLNLPQLDHIPDSLFENQTECMNFLAIMEGNMEEVPIDILLPLKYLSTLSISNNKISELKEDLWRLKLITLILNGNNISRIHFGVFPHSLKSLSLSDNQLESLNSSLVYLTNLYWLMLANNRIKTLNGELIGLSNLEVLVIRGNQIENLDGSLHNLSKLENLDASQNRISTLGESFRGLDSLNKLNLSYNLITQLHDTDFASLINLAILDLSYNHLNYLGEYLRHLRTLRILNLAGNRLIETGVSFNCLNGLRSLDLSGNILENFNLFNNSHLDQEENEICHFTKRNRLRRLYLSGNPLRCNSNVISVMSQLQEKNVIIEGNPC